MQDGVFEQLKSLSGAYEVAEIVGRYRFYRPANNGRDQKVILEILDYGPSNPNSRYGCYATSDDGRTATGNSDSSVENALLHLRWEHLDKDVY